MGGGGGRNKRGRACVRSCSSRAPTVSHVRTVGWSACPMKVRLRLRVRVRVRMTVTLTLTLTRWSACPMKVAIEGRPSIRSICRNEMRSSTI